MFPHLLSARRQAHSYPASRAAREGSFSDTCSTRAREPWQLGAAIHAPFQDAAAGSHALRLDQCSTALSILPTPPLCLVGCHGLSTPARASGSLLPRRARCPTAVPSAPASCAG